MLFAFVASIAPKRLGVDPKASARELELGIAKEEGAITVPYTPRVVRAHQVVQAARRMASVSSTSKVDTRH
ncbi:hypothetical protein [Pseudomonas kielensis]|jgi:putative transport protein|uniref:hypothetical protein n=1 Tax=Pseudomonas kielensis TaxID=2762577 RepID=UPI001E5D55C1|nr:hypothetical protein [Pseudomonas kielensis]UZM15705.1 hypothetical protein LZV00_08180 [Pseudomonas kielensis]